ncbi:MAG TPA: type III-B CRISPR module-associated protein Cmr5 [Flavilitoribacter sp.]|nr:type III-B CRISPR module-associated protein Cmr5 [Flavilitoribacter sp.]
MKKRIKNMLPSAYRAIRDHKKLSEPIDREFQAYISAMGPSILQMGLIPTLAVYADTESGSAKDRYVILELIKTVLIGNEADYPEKESLSSLEGSLFEFSISEAQNTDVKESVLREFVLDVIVALKLSIRTFKLQSA